MPEAIYQYNIPTVMHLLDSNNSLRNMVDKEIEFLMTFLPPQTKCIGTKVLTVTEDQSQKVHIIFEHPWFERGTEIIVNYSRQVSKDPSNEDELLQFHLLESIEYKTSKEK